MLFIHETHAVIGPKELEFEATVRDDYMPLLAGGDDARLLYFMHLSHGGGLAYRVTTVTAVKDGAAYGRLVERFRSGDLREWAAATDRLRHTVASKIIVPAPFSPVQDIDLSTVPTDPKGEHELSLFMEDSAWPYEGKLDDYLEKAQKQYAPSLEEGRHFKGKSMLELQMVFQTAWGAAPKRREVILWQKVVDLDRIQPLIMTELTPEQRAPGTWMNDAFEVRDDWESRLLRTTKWSPWY
ncbi:MAG: hypothetical protein JWL73_1282 [Actinomycetia bacterium]|nr:hypothetical protein [Actinomycetes bacterium]